MNRTNRNQRKELFTELLINLRKKQNITQNELAERLSEPQSFVSKVENGERRLDFIELLEYLEALGKSPVEFIQQSLKRFQED